MDEWRKDFYVKRNKHDNVKASIILSLVTFFDCLHDMGDPVGAVAHVRETLNSNGSWMIVEPMAQDDLAANLNPVGRIYYNLNYPRRHTKKRKFC